MSSFDVYIAARDQERTDSWDDLAELRALDNQIRTDMGRAYRLLDGVNERAAELAGPAVLPRPSRQTDKQRRVAACPRCGSKEAA